MLGGWRTPPSLQAREQPCLWHPRTSEMLKVLFSSLGAFLAQSFINHNPRCEEMAHGLKNKRVLPDNFASTVLDLELEIETGKFSAESVNRLTALYMEAVEYYAAYESDKYTYFQDKLTKLLSNQKVYDQLESSATKERKPPDNPPPTNTQAAAKPTIFNHRKQMELNMIMGEKKAQDMTKELLQSYGSSSRQLNKLVQENLKTQESDIARR